MPMPKPKSDESHDDWMDRCMGDDVMVGEFPDDKQRAAVCEQQWKKGKEKKSMKQSKELRYVPFENWEVREEDDKPPKLIGYAAVFNQEAVIFGLWREKISPGAFKKTIKENEIRALWNHNTDLPLGRNRAKPPTLSLGEDEKGLKVEITPPDTQAGRDAVTSIKRGDVSQMSIAFQIIKQLWTIPEDKNELPLRDAKEMKLFEVSPVTFPAFEQTSISARSALEPDADPDPRDEALRLALAADHGLELTTEQRQVIAAAVELYQPYLSEPGDADGSGAHSELHETEPEIEANEDHSDESEPEDGREAVHYSAEERERRLNDLITTMYPL